MATVQSCCIECWHRCLALCPCQPAFSSRPVPSLPLFFLQRNKSIFCQLLKLACLASHLLGWNSSFIVATQSFAGDRCCEHFLPVRSLTFHHGLLAVLASLRVQCTKEDGLTPRRSRKRCAVLGCSVLSDYDPVDCSLSGSSVRGILLARILEWVAMPSSRGSSQPRDQTWVSRVRAGKPMNTGVGSLTLLQGIFPTQESNQGLLHCRQITS